MKRLDDKKEPDLTHMPEYIKNVPFYLESGTQQPVLDHQRQKIGDKTSIYNHTMRGLQQSTSVVTKFRKGACTNCGAMTHTAKTCIERPRKIGAKYTGKDIGADEVIHHVKLNYEGKRDRWNGYDPNQYQAVIDEWQVLEEERQRRREQEIHAKLLKKAERRQAGLSSESDSSDEDPDKQTGTQEEFVSKDPKVRTAVLNLRQREDVAKYLRNLDPKSAAYDGKSRMMKENPNPDLPDDLQLFKGDNFVKFTGDALNLLQ